MDVEDDEMDARYSTLDVAIPAKSVEAFNTAVSSGSLAALKAVLLASCSEADREMVEHLLPPDLIAQDKPAA